MSSDESQTIPPPAIPPRDIKLRNSWRRRIRCLKTAHFEAADAYATRTAWVAGALIVFSALSTSFAYIGVRFHDHEALFVVAAAITGMLTSILAGLQAYFRFSERAERHRTIGAALARLELMVEASISPQSENDTQAKPDSLSSLLDEWARVTNGAPVLSEKRYQRHCGKFDGCDCHDE
jgi:uncharacterized integral membrane protein